MAISSFEIPNDFELGQAYPNPFNPRTNIRYSIPVNAELIMSIYDLQGRLVTNLVNGMVNAGYHEVVWDGSQSSSGLYFIRMNAYNMEHSLQFNQIQKIMLVK